MEENFPVFDFALNEEGMQAIAALDKAENSFFSPTTIRQWWRGLCEWWKNAKTIMTAPKKRKTGKEGK